MVPGECVSVVTGGSSGIARASAVALAKRGGSVVLAARDGEALEEAVRECEQAGGAALACPTDVTDERQVERLAACAVERFGRIDVWINAAAVIAYGEFEKTPAEVYRRVIETNLFGQIHGARAVLPYFRRAGRGTLINIASVWGSVSSPYVSSYVVSKHGVRAFSESLQEGLRLEKATRNIQVCTILPQCVDTPIFDHAATYGVNQPKAIPPIVDPGRVVNAIVASIKRPRRQRSVALAARALEFGHAVLPTVYSRIVPTVMNLFAFSDIEAADSPGNLFAPMTGRNQVAGGWRNDRLRVVASSGGAAALAAAVIGGAGLARRYRRRRSPTADLTRGRGPLR